MTSCAIKTTLSRSEATKFYMRSAPGFDRNELKTLAKEIAKRNVKPKGKRFHPAIFDKKEAVLEFFDNRFRSRIEAVEELGTDRVFGKSKVMSPGNKTYSLSVKCKTEVIRYGNTKSYDQALIMRERMRRIYKQELDRRKNLL